MKKEGLVKKSVSAILCVLFLCSVSVSARVNTDTASHGIWLENMDISSCSARDFYTAFPNKYSITASDNNFIEFENEKNLTVGWTFRDDIGIKFSELWVSLANFDNSADNLYFTAKNLEGFDNPLDSKGTYVESGSEYGNFTWHRFELPINLKYGQPTTYELNLHLNLSTIKNISIDALYLGNGTYKPYSKSPPLPTNPYEVSKEKVMVFLPPLTSNFSESMDFTDGDLVEQINIRCPRGAPIEIPLAVAGGVNLGTVRLIDDFPLINSSGEKLCDIEKNIISYLRKRFDRNGNIKEVVESSEYIIEGSELEIRHKRTGLFWLRLDIPVDAVPGKYSTKLMFRTENSSDLFLPLVVDVLPYMVDIKATGASLDIGPLNTVRVADRIVIHTNPHHEQAKEKKISEEQAWERWSEDLRQLQSCGFNGLVINCPTINSPAYFTDTETLGKISKLVYDYGFKKLFINIDGQSKTAFDTEGTLYLEEYPPQLQRIVDVVRSNSLTPVLTYTEETPKLELLLDAIDSLDEKPKTMCIRKTASDTITKEDYPLVNRCGLDWQTKSNQANNKGYWVYDPHTSWGGHHEMRQIAGIYSLIGRSTFMGLASYNVSYGNTFNDLDVRLADGNYSPADMMYTYPTEGYECLSSLRWLMFRQGLVDMSLTQTLLDKIEQNPSGEAEKAAKEFLGSILNPPSQTLERLKELYTPSNLDRIRELVIDYLLWIDDKEEVKTLKVTSKLVFTIGSKTLMADNSPVEMTVEPVIIDSSTYIPARYLVEPINGTALWEGLTRSVILEAAGHKVTLSIGNDKAEVDGKTVTLSRAPLIKDGRTLIPLRAASTLLGAEVSWDGATREATCLFDFGVRYFVHNGR